jgi:hypothetical protein
MRLPCNLEDFFEIFAAWQRADLAAPHPKRRQAVECGFSLILKFSSRLQLICDEESCKIGAVLKDWSNLEGVWPVIWTSNCNLDV